MVYAYKSFWIYAIKFIYNVGRNNFSLPIFLSWNIDVDLCPDFKSPNMQIYFFSLLCLLLAVRDTKHSPRDVQMDTGNETRLSWLQWSLLNFWFLNYCRPCLSYLLLSFLGGLRLHIWVFRFFYYSGCQCKSACPVLWGLVLQTHFAWNSFHGEQQGQKFSRLGRVSEHGAFFCALHAVRKQRSLAATKPLWILSPTL